MKKLLVLAAVSVLFASSAMAAITDTAHDLSVGSTGATIEGTSDEICVYCHTPHGASAAGTAPLWNRTTVSATAYYANPAGSINGTMSLTGVNASDAILCLSCHDGSSLTGALNNPPNSGGTNPTSNIAGTSEGNLGTDLSNDHPIGFVYAGINALDSEIRATPTNSLDVTYGPTNDQMWCSSCHDVHDNTDKPFLAFSNAGSGLCLSCHIK